jgi:hypothetical protein
MNATIEREISLMRPACRRVNDATQQDPTKQYKAPLATFMALVASARASAQAADDALSVRPGAAGGPRR